MKDSPHTQRSEQRSTASVAPAETPGRIPELEPTRRNADYWLGCARFAYEHGLIDAILIDAEQAINAWKNAAYAAHDKITQSATNAAPQGGLANARDHDSGVGDDASVMGAAPAEAAPSEAAAFEQPDFMTEAQKAAYWFDLYLEETAKRRKLERERNAWEAKFNAECEKHDATTMRAMKAERDLAETNKRDSRNFARMVEQGLRADRAERALRIAQSTNPAPISKEAAAFLLGEGPLDGVWFGDPHPRYPGTFWWRAFLRQEVSRYQKEQP